MVESEKASHKGLRNIIFLGLVSLFADISAEMVYPLIPLYLTSTFGATPALVGLIEGIAESLASLLKVFSGYITDRFQRKKALAFLGYSTGLVYKLALIVAGSWTGILFARVIDRFGKGVRTSPRDVMVSDSADKESMGKAFGIHKALDMVGSSIGIFLAFLLMKNISSDAYHKVFYLSIIPVVIALFMFAFIHEKKGPRTDLKREHFWNNISKLNTRLKLYLIVTFIFTLGNSSNAFLFLRAKDFGFSSSDTILLYFIYTTTAALLSITFGKISDKVGRKKVLVAGYVLFAIVYLGFATCFNKAMMVGVFILYGFFTAMTAGVERAFVAEISPRELKGTILGLQSTLAGIALFPASMIAGLLWDKFGGQAPFYYGGSLALIAAVILSLGLKEKTKLE